ncbi:MAG: lipoate--protein ligase [Firmicutes bacterium]|nr:lipoate--protein ligase [Bacillota bacterium]
MNMNIIRNNNNDPRYNLALEEYVFRNLDLPGGCLMLWRNKPSIIIGRYQNTFEEINPSYVAENGIEVVRRITGGGAVYHDLGNINFSFINRSNAEVIDFAAYNLKVIDALAQIEIQAELNSRNDIVVDGKKISGNAQIIHKGKVLHHGTFLYDSKLENLQQALNVDPTKYESKSIKSVISRVANVSDYLRDKVSAEKFMEILLANLCKDNEVYEYKLNSSDISAIGKLYNEKYNTWDWNYGSAPAFNFKKANYFPWGKVEVRLYIDQGIIQQVKIYGDFFGIEDMADFEGMLMGMQYDKPSVMQKLSTVSLAGFFCAAGTDELVNCFFD